MKIAVEGCLHGELEKVYETIAEIEAKQQTKVDLLLCCGDFEALRSLSDLKCMAVPDKYKHMGGFYKYYTGELKVPILTIVIGGNHEASNYFQELPFGGWLCPNIYYLGYCGVIDIFDEKAGITVLTIGGLSGIYNPKHYLRGRYEKPPYSNDTLRSVYHVRNIDTLRLKSMPTESVQIFLSHDWPRGITKFGNVERLLRCKPFFRQDIERDELGSMPGMEILETLKPDYWFSGHLHVKFAALVDEKTKFLALDKCLPNRRFLQILSIGESVGPFKLQYNPKWLCILKSTNALQNPSPREQHMPGPGYNGRWNFTPKAEEENEIRALFNDNFEIPENFAPVGPTFDPQTDDIKRLFVVPHPEPLSNPQTVLFCAKLGIDDPMTLICSLDASSISASCEPTKNEDEIPLDDSDQDDQAEPVKNQDEIPLDESDEGGEENVASPTKPKKSMMLPPPKHSAEISEIDFEPKRCHDSTEEGKMEANPPKKMMKRRNAAMYATASDDDK